MRSITGGMRALIAAGAADGVAHWWRVSVANASGTMIDLTTLEGFDWTEYFECGEDIDNPVGTFSMGITRDMTHVDELSAAPVWGGSPVNRDDAAAYAPLLYPGRRVLAECAIKSPGVTPSGGDWVPLFEGRIDNVDWHATPIVVSGRDNAGVLVDTFVQSTLPLFTLPPGAVDIEDVMQAALDLNYIPAPTIYTPASPGFAITDAATKPQEKKSLWETLQQDYALLIGWELRYRYDASDVSQLTFRDPDRARTSIDTTFGPDEYQDITSLDINNLDVRNKIRVNGFDVNGQEITALAQDLTSISANGIRYMEINLPLGSQLNTDTELQVLADAALADLKDPLTTQEMKTLFFYPVQLGDRYTFEPNADHYDDPQDLAVTGYRHRLEAGEGWTTMQVRGTVAGSYHAWFRKVRGPETILPSSAKRKGRIEWLATEPLDSSVSGAPIWNYGAQFKLWLYTDYTTETQVALHFTGDWSQAPWTAEPVKITYYVDGVAYNWAPGYDDATDVFSVYAAYGNGADVSYRIRADGNAWTSDFESEIAAPQSLVSPPQEGRQSSKSASAYLSNNRTFNLADYFSDSRVPGTTDDAAAWQIAVAAAVTAFSNGRQAFLEVPDNTHIATDITCPRDVSIYGPGIGSAQSINASSQKSLKITGSAAAKHIIRDVQFDKVNLVYGATSGDYGRGCTAENILVQNCTSAPAVIYRHHSYLTRLLNSHLTGNQTGVYFDFATAVSDSGANMVISNTTIDVCADALYVNGITADGCQIFVTDCDLEHTTSAVLKAVSVSGEACIYFSGANLELNTGYIFDNAGMQVWLTRYMALSLTELAFIKQSAGLFFMGEGRMSWTTNKFALLTGGKIIVTPGTIFSAARFHGEGSAGSGSGYGAAVPYAVSGSGGGKIILPGQTVFRAQTNQAITALTNAAPGPVTASVWWKLDGNNRTWDLDVACPFTGSPTSNTLRMTLTNGVTTVRHDIAFPLFAGYARLTVVNIAGSTFNVFGEYIETASGKVTKMNYSTTDYASATDCDRTIALETIGTTKAPLTVTVVNEDVAGPIFVGL